MKIRSILLLTISLLILTACDLSLAEDITPPPGYKPPTPAPTLHVDFPSIPPSPARGQPVYQEYCAACHGGNGLGNGPRANSLPVPVAAVGLRDISSQTTPIDWYTVITLGRQERSMPSFSHLSEQERWDTLSYIYMLNTSTDEIRIGEDLFKQHCQDCHGVEGQGASGTALNELPLTGLRTAISMYRAIYDGAGEMPAFSGLKEEEIWAITAYMRILPFDMSSQQPPTTTPSPTPQSPTQTHETGAETGPTAQGSTASPPITATATEPVSSYATINGMVVNGSGGELPADMAVTLMGFEPDMNGSYQQVFTEILDISDEGEFTFTSAEMTLNRVILAAVDYQGMTYQSEPVIIETETDSIDVVLVFYETSTDSADLNIERIHVFFDYSEEDIVQVIELFVFSNDSDQTIVSDEPGAPVITYTIPEGAQNLQFQSGFLGGRYVKTAEGFGDTSAILPGTNAHQVLFAFDLPYERQLDFILEIEYPTESVLLMVPEGVRIESDRLIDSGTEIIEGVAVHIYTSENLVAGDELHAALSGKPKGQNNEIAASLENNLVIGLAGLGSLLIIAGIYLYFRNRSQDEEIADEEPENKEEDNLKDAESIMDVIITLDEQYKNKAITAEAYQKRRGQLKDRLKKIL